MSDMDRVKVGVGNTLRFRCPACQAWHCVSVGEGGWKWNGSMEAPTLDPSVAVRQTLYGPDRETFEQYDGPMPPTEHGKGLCHSQVTDGMIRFYEDSTHGMAGQTVALPARVWWPERALKLVEDC